MVGSKQINEVNLARNQTQCWKHTESKARKHSFEINLFASSY